MPDEDVLVVRNILIALQSLGMDSATGQPLCVRYKVHPNESGYLLKGAMHQTNLFEVTLEDLLYLHGINPARIQSVALGRSNQGGPCELLIQVLDSKQHVMVASTTAFFSTVRKLKMQRTKP